MLFFFFSWNYDCCFNRIPRVLDSPIHPGPQIVGIMECRPTSPHAPPPTIGGPVTLPHAFGSYSLPMRLLARACCKAYAQTRQTPTHSCVEMITQAHLRNPCHALRPTRHRAITLERISEPPQRRAYGFTQSPDFAGDGDDPPESLLEAPPPSALAPA